MERLEGIDVGSWEKWGGVGSEEMARWERCKGSEVAKWENGEVPRWEVPDFIQEWVTWGES